MDSKQITTKSKVGAIKSFIGVWLKDQRFYCNQCGEEWNEQFHIYESCCQTPQFGRNMDHTKGLIEQNKLSQATRAKTTGATEDNTFRSAVSLPPRLYSDLEGFFEQYGEKLFNDNTELHAFMKEFPQFCSCKEV